MTYGENIYKYIVFHALDLSHIRYYVFGTFVENNDILPLFSFYTITELHTYLTDAGYNLEDILFLIKKGL